MKVLVAYDGSETSNCALEFSLRMKNVIDKYYVVYIIPQLVGTTLKGLSRIILGSVSSEILKLSDVPVLICSADACK